MKKPVQLSSGSNRTLRLSEKLEDGLEERRKALAAKFPGMTVTVSDIIRNAIEKELDAVDD